MAQVMYERLERYDYLTGAYKGSHVKLYDNVTMREGDAMSYDTAATIGFTQSDMLTAIHTGAIIAADTANASLAAEQAAHAATQATLAATQSELSAALAKLATAQP